MHTIDCKHCGSLWHIPQPGLELALTFNHEGCRFCTSDEGKADLSAALEMGFGKQTSPFLTGTGAARMSLAEAQGDPLAKQVGGDHYKTMKIQPVEFIEANGIPFLEGNVIKYVVRHVGKGGVADLRKAKHYIDLLLKLRYQETP